MPLDLSESLIREHSSAESFRRGQEYERRGAVVSLIQRGHELQAEVEGSELEPYTVRIAFDETGVSAGCSCPDDWGDWCKHIVAALLAYLHAPETVEQRPPLDPALATLDREQLQAIVRRLVQRDPLLADVVESEIALVRAQATGAPATEALAPPPVVDTRLLRREVRAALHSLDDMRHSEAYWHVAQAYDHAVRWLTHARAAYQASGRDAEWATYLDGLIEQHRRKYRLRPMLEALRT